MKKLPILTLLFMMMAVPLSSVAQDEFSGSAPVPSEPNSQADEDQGGDVSEIDLGVLDSQPNVLHGIDGLHQGRVPLNAISPNTLKTFVSVVDLVRREYPDQKNDDELFYHAINGMLTKVDSHAEFLDAKAFNNLQSFTTGNVGDVGITAVWQEDAGRWVVTKVEAESSATKAGIAIGDYLYQIGDVRLTGSQTQNDVAQLLSGILNTKVDVTFSKAGRSKLTKTLERTHSTQSNIEILVRDGIVIVKLPVFQTNTREQILNGVSSAGIPVQGMIIDVRNNPGGVLDSAVDVASLFMRNEIVTQVEGRHGIERVMHTSGSPLLDEIPLLILQNRYSASAAEVLASGLQTQGRALILGEASYGKGSVQSIIPIGDNQAVKLTTAHYITATGEKIDKIGVKPDVTFPQVDHQDELIDEWLERALTIMQEGKLTTGVEFAPVGGF
ncbi:C-terminal processing peptidase [Moraxella bovoculi 237]|uniref:C-terminal processing peptidase n=1 Tax=Moraxella bovoculi 237 TaxID=743974 RepID=A0A066UFZ7_9GAMM|nr:S41 family peptidase [Moraxella bovoculi]KDN26000.1 C-terminal processing peptidase [Moraxella bovoculi 237]